MLRAVTSKNTCITKRSDRLDNQFTLLTIWYYNLFYLLLIPTFFVLWSKYPEWLVDLLIAELNKLSLRFRVKLLINLKKKDHGWQFDLKTESAFLPCMWPVVQVSKSTGIHVIHKSSFYLSLIKNLYEDYIRITSSFLPWFLQHSLRLRS